MAKHFAPEPVRKIHKPHMRNPQKYWRERIITISLCLGVCAACIAVPVGLVCASENTQTEPVVAEEEVETALPKRAPIYDAPAVVEPVQEEAREEEAPVETQNAEETAVSDTIGDNAVSEEELYSDYDYEDSSSEYSEYTNYSSDYSGGGVLTAAGGVNYYNGNRETWYSQRVLPGEGLNIPGRHVADDGTIRDGDGYICVASDNYPKGSVIETSLGTGKVYDSVGGDPTGNTVDIYVDW